MNKGPNVCEIIFSLHFPFKIFTTIFKKMHKTNMFQIKFINPNFHEVTRDFFPPPFPEKKNMFHVQLPNN